MANCLFCKIIDGQVPSYKVWEDDNYLAFLDIFPIKTGHTLLIPKKHSDYFFDLDEKEIANLMHAAKKVSQKLKTAFTPRSGKVGVVIYGLDVDHVHIHLVPLDRTGDLDFNRKKPATKEDLEKTLQQLKLVE